MSCLLMAAGRATRFGSCKQLALVNDVPLINCVIKQYQQAGIEQISVVLGANREEIAKLIPKNVDILLNKDWQSGLGSSISFGVKTLMKSRQEPTHILVGLGDQIGVKSEDLNNLMNTQRENNTHLVVSCYKNILGVPASFPSSYSKELMALTGDEGAKYLLKRHVTNVIKVNMHSAAFDIDYPNDLERWTSKNSV